MTDHVTAYVPLFRFSCETDAFAVAPGVRLQRSSMPPDLDLKALSDHEKQELLGVGYWLVIDEHAADGHSAAERLNRWAFALWLVRPTDRTSGVEGPGFPVRVAPGGPRN